MDDGLLLGRGDFVVRIFLWMILLRGGRGLVGGWRGRKKRRVEGEVVGWSIGKVVREWSDGWMEADACDEELGRGIDLVFETREQVRIPRRGRMEGKGRD